MEMIADPDARPVTGRAPPRLAARKWHLTYKTHVDKDDIYLMLRRKDCKMTSIVHEIGDEAEEDDLSGPTPYEHTHVFVEYREKLETRNINYFDIEGVEHCNWQPVRSLVHQKTIVLRYHKGHKKKAGKPHFVAPVWIEQIGCEEYILQEDAFKLIHAAPGLDEACLALGVQPKCVSDVVAIMRQQRKRGFTQLSDCVDKERFVVLDWDRTKSLVLRGPAGIGKTQWALAQFERPILVNEDDCLRNIPLDCDGLVFDEKQYNQYRGDRQVRMADVEMGGQVALRNVNADIPPRMPRIFTCNEGEHPFDMEHPVKKAALERRIVTLDRTEALFE